VAATVVGAGIYLGLQRLLAAPELYWLHAALARRRPISAAPAPLVGPAPAAPARNGDPA
jgi:hypothetical protein